MLKKAMLSTLAIVFVIAGGAAEAQTPVGAVITVDNEPANMGESRVRIGHLSPDAPNVDIWINGSLTLSDLAFEEFTPYLTLTAMTNYNVQVVPTGATEPVVIDVDLNLASGTDYTVLATDILANISPLVLIDDGGTPAAGNSHVRFVHASPDAPAVDIAVTGGPVLISDVEFGEFAPYAPVPAGTYDLEVRLAGTDTAVLYLPGLVLPEGAVVTAYASGLAADGFADRTMYLNDNRFRIEVTWEDFEGNTGVGFQNDLTEDTGYFTFFNPDNVELVVKALDGTFVNGNYWIFYGSLTNVQFTMTVTDTMTGATKTYVNDSREFASVGDTEAFPQ